MQRKTRAERTTITEVFIDDSMEKEAASSYNGLEEAAEDTIASKDFYR